MKTSTFPFYVNRAPSVFKLLVQNFVFCTGIALVLWKFVPSIGHHGFLSSFIYSQAIGNSICILALTTARVFRHYEIDSQFIRVASITVISIVGAVIGITIARLLEGQFLVRQEYDVDINNIAISALIAIIASFLFNFYLGHRQNLLMLQLAASEESRRADHARHAMLQAQLEPHMLFNTLANLRVLINSDTDKAISMLDRLDSFLRETLSSSNQQNHSLAQEFNVLDNYLALMKVRFGNRLHYKLNLDNACKDIMVPSLLLQPIVENAIKHGIEPKIEGGDVVVSVKCIDDKTVLTVRDSGVGFTADEPNNSASEGFGLSNLKERLIQTYGNTASLDIAPNRESPTGTTMTLTLPPLPSEPLLGES